MRRLTIDELTGLMRNCAGIDETVDPDADILDTSFELLGYDSLAVMQIRAEIEQQVEVSLSPDAVGIRTTPRQVIDHVNQLLATGV
jgi:act minimal PKS acyl carrier protein